MADTCIVDRLDILNPDLAGIAALGTEVAVRGSDGLGAGVGAGDEDDIVAGEPAEATGDALGDATRGPAAAPCCGMSIPLCKSPAVIPCCSLAAPSGS